MICDAFWWISRISLTSFKVFDVFWQVFVSVLGKIIFVFQPKLCWWKFGELDLLVHPFQKFLGKTLKKISQWFRQVSIMKPVFFRMFISVRWNLHFFLPQNLTSTRWNLHFASSLLISIHASSAKSLVFNFHADSRIPISRKKSQLPVLYFFFLWRRQIILIDTAMCIM